MNATKDAINRTKIDIKLEKVADEKPLTLELGATYAMLREYVCYSEDLDTDSYDILAAMPVAIDNYHGVVNNIYFYIVAFDAYKLRVDDYKNGHLITTYNDRDEPEEESFSVEVLAAEVFQIISTMPRRGNQHVRFGPSDIDVFNLVTPISIKDIKYAKIYSLQNKISDLRLWPRDALFGWASHHLKLDASQIQIARDMDQKYKIIEHCQEMFAHQCSRFNKTAAKKIKESGDKPFGHLPYGPKIGYAKEEQEINKLSKDFGMHTYAVNDQPEQPMAYNYNQGGKRVPVKNTNYDIVTFAGLKRIVRTPPGVMTEINDINFTSDKMMGCSEINYIYPDEYKITVEKSVRRSLDLAKKENRVEIGLMAFLEVTSTGHVYRMELKYQFANDLFLEEDDICLINLNRSIILRITNRLIEPEKPETFIPLKAITKNAGNIIPIPEQIEDVRPIGEPMVTEHVIHERFLELAQAPHDGTRQFIGTDFLTIYNTDKLHPYPSLSWTYVSSEGVRCTIEIDKRNTIIGNQNIEIAAFLAIEGGPRQRMTMGFNMSTHPCVEKDDLCVIVVDHVLAFHIKGEVYSPLLPWSVLNIMQTRSHISNLIKRIPVPAKVPPMENSLDALAHSAVQANFQVQYNNTNFLSTDEGSLSELSYSNKLPKGSTYTVTVKKKIDAGIQHVIELAAYVEIVYREDADKKSKIQYRMDIGYEVGVIPSIAREGDVFVMVVDNIFTLHIRRPLLSQEDPWLSLKLEPIRKVMKDAQKQIDAQEHLAKRADKVMWSRGERKDGKKSEIFKNVGR